MSNFFNDHWNRVKTMWGAFILGGVFIFLKLSLFGVILALAAAGAAFVLKDNASAEVRTHFSHLIKVTLLVIVVFVVTSILTFLHILMLIMGLAMIAFGALCLYKALSKQALDFIQS